MFTFHSWVKLVEGDNALPEVSIQCITTASYCLNKVIYTLYELLFMGGILLKVVLGKRDDTEND